jgi:hypothetical protein
MAVEVSYLRDAPLRESYGGRTLEEAIAGRQPTAFLCHSHLDKNLALGLQARLTQQGWNVFIDWQHTPLSGRPTSATVDTIQKAIQRCDWLIYLATKNSEQSRWCPWEIGYADGKKGRDTVVIVATTEANVIYGSEYLSIYRQIDQTSANLFIVDPRSPGSAKYMAQAFTRPSPTL